MALIFASLQESWARQRSPQIPFWLGENLSKRLETQNTAPEVDACTSTAPARAGEQESITGLAKAGLLRGWRAAPAPAVAARCWHARGAAPGAACGPRASGLSAAHLPAGTPCGPPRRADVQMAGGEDAWEPLESPGMNALVNQGHSSAPPAPGVIYSAPGAHPGGVQSLGCKFCQASCPLCLVAPRSRGKVCKVPQTQRGARMLSGGLSLPHPGPSPGGLLPCSSRPARSTPGQAAHPAGTQGRAPPQCPGERCRGSRHLPRAGSEDAPAATRGPAADQEQVAAAGAPPARG